MSDSVKITIERKTPTLPFIDVKIESQRLENESLMLIIAFNMIDDANKFYGIPNEGFNSQEFFKVNSPIMVSFTLKFQTEQYLSAFLKFIANEQ